VAAIPILNIKNARKKTAFSILLALLVIISLIAASRDPHIFKSEMYCDESDIAAVKWVCSHDGNF
jgi:hypothetical protein